MAPTFQKVSTPKPGRLALLTALSITGTLLYVFVLLVPAWRTVTVDRALIRAFLANHSDGEYPNSEARLWDVLARDPLLRSRSANAFRECLASEPGRGGNVTMGGSWRNESGDPVLTMERNLMEQLADAAANATDLMNTTTMTTTAPPMMTTNATDQDTKQPRKRSHKVETLSDRCWFLNLHWSESDRQSTEMTASHRALLQCTRALFLLAVCLIICYCIGLTGALYGCFAARLTRPGRLLLLVVHCLVLSQLVALAILQDTSARLAVARLSDLLAGSGFPEGCAAAVHAHRGVCSLVLLCILCVVSAVHMLLLLLPMSPQEAEAAGRKQHANIVSTGAGAHSEDGEKMRECDDTEDTNPLI